MQHLPLGSRVESVLKNARTGTRTRRCVKRGLPLFTPEQTDPKTQWIISSGQVATTTFPSMTTLGTELTPNTSAFFKDCL